jgi:hypothetical protein
VRARRTSRQLVRLLHGRNKWGGRSRPDHGRYFFGSSSGKPLLARAFRSLSERSRFASLTLGNGMPISRAFSRTNFSNRFIAIATRATEAPSARRRRKVSIASSEVPLVMADVQELPVCETMRQCGRDELPAVAMFRGERPPCKNVSPCRISRRHWRIHNAARYFVGRARPHRRRRRHLSHQPYALIKGSPKSIE